MSDDESTASAETSQRVLELERERDHWRAAHATASRERDEWRATAQRLFGIFADCLKTGGNSCDT